VIGGGAGFFAMHKIERSARIGVSLCLFSITFILGSAQGVTRRTGLPWSAFWTAPQPSALWLPVKDVTPEEAIKLIQLRAEIEGSDELDAEEKRSVWYLITSEVTGNEQTIQKDNLVPASGSAGGGASSEVPRSRIDGISIPKGSLNSSGGGYKSITLDDLPFSKSVQTPSSRGGPGRKPGS
jgi:hypothetical protein